MSCGFSPQMFEMISKMQQEAEGKKVQEESSSNAKIDELRKRSQVSAPNPSSMEGGQYDWTRTYDSWDKWEDQEEINEQLNQERKKAEERSNRVPTSCDHDHSAERKIMDMSTKDKLDACEAFKLAGNAYHREGQYMRAAERYHRALIYFEYCFPDTPEEEARHDRLRLSALLNSAACQLKTGQYDEVVNNCYQALKLEPGSVKALYRRAVVHRIKDRFEEAQADISACLALAPDDFYIRKEAAMLRNKILAYRRNMRQLSTAMFTAKPTPSPPSPSHPPPTNQNGGEVAGGAGTGGGGGGVKQQQQQQRRRRRAGRGRRRPRRHFIRSRWERAWINRHLA